jgi:HlyD family secretion protein
MVCIAELLGRPLAMKLLAKIVVVLLVLAGGGALLLPWAKAYWNNRNRPSYRLAPLTRGEIVMFVNSTGTIQPERRVSVGSFASGPIKKLYVDYNSEVKKGDLLAEIDPRIYKANVDRDQALCASAQAEVARVTALLEQAGKDEERANALRKKSNKYISDTELDKFKFTRACLEAQLGVAEAAVEQAEGNRRNSEANLSYTEIRAPVEGVVIDRKIDEGQTLAASFQTPELFVVAPGMDKRMYVYAAVDEADIGLIRQAQRRDQEVVFTVDAYPDDLFQGKISQVRVNPTTTQNVVTYTVVVDAPNPERKLLPGMTANLSFQIERRSDILKVPNAALRFYPKPEQVRPEDRDLLEGSGEGASPDDQAKAAEIQRSAAERALARRNRNRRHVWVVEDDYLRAVEIITGTSDSTSTELVSGKLVEGQEVVTGIKLIGR